MQLRIRKRTHTWLAVVLILIALAAIAYAFRVQIEYAQEDVLYALDPSAARAFAYGERHFSATDPAQYDVNRAAYFFWQARAADPTTPYVYHELARIAFLRGDFTRALQYIDDQIAIWGDKAPNSYYVRGLIEGYMGEYDAAIADYAHYLASAGDNWAAMNDYAWVLLKAKRFSDAADITAKGLAAFPNNPWLLNSHATALFELGRDRAALENAQKADAAVAGLTERQWLTAYPGNDPDAAAAGIMTFKRAVGANMQMIENAIASSTAS